MTRKLYLSVTWSWFVFAMLLVSCKEDETFTTTNLSIEVDPSHLNDQEEAFVWASRTNGQSLDFQTISNGQSLQLEVPENEPYDLTYILFRNDFYLLFTYRSITNKSMVLRSNLLSENPTMISLPLTSYDGGRICYGTSISGGCLLADGSTSVPENGPVLIYQREGENAVRYQYYETIAGVEALHLSADDPIEDFTPITFNPGLNRSASVLAFPDANPNNNFLVYGESFSAEETGNPLGFYPDFFENFLTVVSVQESSRSSWRRYMVNGTITSFTPSDAPLEILDNSITGINLRTSTDIHYGIARWFTRANNISLSWRVILDPNGDQGNFQFEVPEEMPTALQQLIQRPDLQPQEIQEYRSEHFNTYQEFINNELSSSNYIDLNAPRVDGWIERRETDIN